jgi:hypothetical protein
MEPPHYELENERVESEVKDGKRKQCAEEADIVGIRQRCSEPLEGDLSKDEEEDQGRHQRCQKRPQVLPLQVLAGQFTAIR